MKQISTLWVLISMSLASYSQNVGIGTGSPAAKLDITSSTSGVLIPRVALTATNSASPLSSPTTSTLVYNTATGGSSPYAVVPGFYYWNATAGIWVQIIDNSSLTGSTTVSNASGANTLSTTVNGVTGSTVPMVNSIGNTSSANTLSTTVNGVTGSTVPIINTNDLSLSGTTITSTTNGVASNALDISSVDNNVYNSDGTLTGNRTVTMGGDNLTFSAVNGNFSYSTTGSGNIAMGNNVSATGGNSFAAGINNTASGVNSTALGANNTSNGAGGFSAGASNTASGPNSTVFGQGNTASGYASLATGLLAVASGGSAFSSGHNTTANGSNSSALGEYTQGNGAASAALGESVEAYSYGEVAVGLYNTGYTPSSTTAYAATDRVFDVGNGTSSTPSDALTILKSGNVGIGNSNPTQALQVNGTTSTTNFQMTNGGTAGYILQSDASGNASWASPSSVGTTNTLTNTTNTIVSTVNGQAASASAVNTVANTSSANTLSTTVNGVAGSTVPIVNSISNSSSANTLSTTVNGVAGSTVPIINTNALSQNGSDQLISTTNGVASTALTVAVAGDVTGNLGASIVAKIQGTPVTVSSLANGNLLQYNSSGTDWVNVTPASVLAGATTVSNTSSANTLSTTVNGVAGGTVPIVNSISNASSANTLSTTVNGVAGSTVPIVNSISNTSSVNTLSTTVNGVAGSTVPIINTNALSLSGNNLTETINGIGSSAQSLSGLTIAGDVTGTLAASTVAKIQGTGVSISSLATNNLLQYNGTNWVNVAPGSALFTAGTGLSWNSSTLNSVWTASGNNIYNNNSANVGIGITSPAAPLEVSASGDMAYLLLNTTAANKRTRINFAQSGTIGMEIGTDYGVANINDLYIYNRATGSTAAYFYPGTDIWLSARGTSSDFYMNASGQVGIGTTSPATSLHVVGNIRMVDGNQASGKVMTSDANGTGSWQSSGYWNYSIPNTGGTAQWVNLGTLTISQQGYSAYFKIISANGYNASAGQNFEVYVRFKTSNASSLDANGFAGDASYWYTGGNNWFNTAGYIKFVGNAAGVNATAYTVYVYLPTYTGNSSFYTVETAGGATWANSGALTTNPGAGSSTIALASMEQDLSPPHATLVSSSTSSTSVTFTPLVTATYVIQATGTYYNGGTETNGTLAIQYSTGTWTTFGQSAGAYHRDANSSGQSPALFPYTMNGTLTLTAGTTYSFQVTTSAGSANGGNSTSPYSDGGPNLPTVVNWLFLW